jgi:uncharacterized membrane protein YdbT with pleckstrin-like domain
VSYIEKNLMNGEALLYQGKLHWIVYLGPVFCFIIAIWLLCWGDEAKFVGMLFFFIALASGIGSYINRATSEFGITNKRVIVKVGFIRRNSLEVLLNKIESIQVDQGIVGRMLGYGSITLSGTGGTKDPFHKIDAPLEFRRKAQEQIAAVQDAR